MDIRPVQPADLNALIAIDGTIESLNYLHVDRAGEGLTIHWKVEERPLRTKWVDRNRPGDELQFLAKQIAAGIEEGVAVLAEHDGATIGQMLAQPTPQFGTMRLIDIRVDYDFRRQGIASGMLYQLITEARSRELRAVSAEVAANNEPACRLLLKRGFDLAGLDTQRHSNHDLVKEAATLLWYASLT